MIKKGLCIAVLALPFATSAALIDLSLETENQFTVSQTDNLTGISTTDIFRFAPEMFDLRLSIEQDTAKATEFASVDVGPFIQHSARTEYENFDFNLSSPFESVFETYLSDEFGVNPASIVEQSSSLDLQVFYNETADPAFGGGDVSIRFGSIFTYNAGDYLGGNGSQETTWLSGRIFLQNVTSFTEYYALKDVTLDDLLHLMDGAYTELSTNYFIQEQVECFGAPGCEPLSQFTNANGVAFGNAAIASAARPVSEPTSILLLLSGVLLAVRRKRS